MGVWGFNPDYHLSLKLLNMPIEEWMFFFCIPYACLFTHEALKFLFPKFKMSKPGTVIVSFFLIVLVSLLLIFNFGKWYTTVNFVLFLLLLGYALKNHLNTCLLYTSDAADE
eukprot:TRINITY_DN508_c0_g5_i2.p1 TRINITY_DN508_c0_g5~~TRINITY_DN508_c0_g5_i2.p1  ORF type:complete len:112 (+),score=5.25 TRINITY_DN508_c0_g5_i2:483-818(+)